MADTKKNYSLGFINTENNIPYYFKDSESAHIKDTTVTGLSTPNTDLYTKGEVNILLDNKLDKIAGKSLSTEDFTTLLKQKLESLSNYNDAELRELIATLLTAINTINGIDDTTTIINSLNEIYNFLDGYNNTLKLSELLNTKVTKVSGKGLSTVDYSTADFNKLASILEGAQVNTVTGVKGNSEASYRTGNINITKDNIGLSNVDNKSSETIRGEITNNNVTTALGFTPIDSATKGANNGIASLDTNGKVPASLLPSYVDDVIEGYLYNSNFYTTRTETIDKTTQEISYQYKDSDKITTESGKIYIDLISSRTYRWSGSTYTEISESLALGETSSTAYPGDKGKEVYDAKHTHSNKSILDGITQLNITDWSKALPNAENTVTDSDYKHITVTETSVSDGTNTFNKYTHPGSGTNPHGTTAGDIGLDKVINTGDSNTPIKDGKDKFTTGGAFTELAKKVDKVTGSSLVPDTKVTSYDNHIESTNNPHNVTKTQIGLSNVDNTSDVNKPISNATLLELNKKPNMINATTSSTPNTDVYTKAEVDAMILELRNLINSK